MEIEGKGSMKIRSLLGLGLQSSNGAILDLLRKNDGVPRNARRATRQLNSASLEFKSRNGRGPWPGRHQYHKP